MNVNDISSGTKQYLFNLVEDIASRDTLVGLVKPLVLTGIENNFNKVTNTLKLIADENGNIDIEKLVDDCITSVFNSRKSSLNIGNIGNVEFGDNVLKLNIFNKFIKFDSNDFIKFKNYLIENYR